MAKAFLPAVIGAATLIQTQAAFGADLNAAPGTWTWTDITADVQHAAGTSTTIGRTDNVGQAPAAAHTFALNNGTGNYTAMNPVSAYYPNIAQNTPIRQRISLDGGATWKTRFQGYADSWNPRTDTSAKVKAVSVTAFGMLGRIAGRKKPLRSALTRAILKSTTATLREYWPLEDPSGATSGASALPGHAPMTVTGTVAFAGMDWAHPSTGGIAITPGTTFGTLPMPQLNGGGELSASVNYPPVSSWTVQASVFIDPLTNDTAVCVLQWTEGGRTWQVFSNGISTDTITLAVNGSVIATEPHIMINEDIIISASQSGGNISWSFKPMLSHPAITGSISTATLDSIDSISANPANFTGGGDFSVGHVRIWDGVADVFKTSTLATSAWNGYKGETADARLTRICGEENITIDLTGASTVAMGLQPLATLEAVLRECEAADHGLLYDGLGPGIAYQCRTARYNAAAALTLDMGANPPQVAPPFEPTFDRQQIKNLYQVTRSGGSSAVAEQVTGPLGTDEIGVEDASATLNVNTDDVLGYHAGWLLNLGTVAGYRYPMLALNMRGIPGKAAQLLAAGGPGFRTTIANPAHSATDLPPDPIDLFAEGWNETTTASTWTLALNCSPFAPWLLAEISSADHGRLSSGGLSTLAAPGLTTTATSVNVNPGPYVWTTDPADLPLDINITGERITVTAIGALSGGTQAFTMTRSVNGVVKAHTAGEIVDVWTPARIGF